MSASRLKFSEIEKPSAGEDPNDAGALAKALSKIEFGKPETFGGRLRSQDNKDVIFERFNIHTPPDICADTQIIAVLGILEDAANPNDDGWFLSDFFAFWSVLQGATKRQLWYHCVDLDDLVKKHVHYLHGNPYKQRKVVLDADILGKAQNGPHSVQRVKPCNLRSTFRASVKNECKAAQACKENVFILMFGHGDKKTYGIQLGQGSVFKPKEFQNITKGVSTKVTLLTTQCYGGGWSCSPLINLSTLTAAGPKDLSLSWRFSGSTGRACGSMFTTAIIGKLTEDPRTGKQLVDSDDDDEGDDEVTDEQEESYAEFSRSVYDALLRNFDRRGYEHNITFSAQDDAWSMSWRERTGIPRHSFKERWDRLENWAADSTLHPGDPQNRDPHTTDEQRAEYVKLRDLEMKKGKQKIREVEGSSHFDATGSTPGKRSTSGLYGGRLDGLISTVSSLAPEYLNSHRGHDESGDDGALHNTLRRILSGQEREQSKVERALRAVTYRMDQMSAADRYLEIMEVAAPDGLHCCELDSRKVIHAVPYEKYETIERLIFDRDKVLFPYPTFEQGRPFYKGNLYLIAAFHNAGISIDLVTRKLDALTATLNQDLELQKQIVERDPEVTDKRQKLFHAYGALRNMSPSQRQSLCAS